MWYYHDNKTILDVEYSIFTSYFLRCTIFCTLTELNTIAERAELVIPLQVVHSIKDVNAEITTIDEAFEV